MRGSAGTGGWCRYLRPPEPNLRPAARRDEDKPRSGGLTRSQREEGLRRKTSWDRWEERGEGERDREVGGDDEEAGRRRWRWRISICVGKSDPDDRQPGSPALRTTAVAQMLLIFLFVIIYSSDSLIINQTASKLSPQRLENNKLWQTSLPVF